MTYIVLDVRYNSDVMIRKDLIIILILLVGFESSFAQSIIQSSCSNDTAVMYPELVAFSQEIALEEMKAEDHYYHDSILIPQSFIDSIKHYVTAYHNAIELSDSIIDYRNFNDLQLEFGEIILTFDSSSNAFYRQNNELIIGNDTLQNYIDSLSLRAQSWRDHEIILTDTTSKINIYGDFNLFYNISAVNQVDLLLAVVDILPCYKSRSGDFNENGLKIALSDINYCDTNSYAYHWLYTVNDNCQIEINSIPTSMDEKRNEFNISIYPNPFGNILNIESDETIEHVKIIGLDGRICLQSQLLNEISLNTTDLKKGLYLLEIKHDRGITHRKLIKN